MTARAQAKYAHQIDLIGRLFVEAVSSAGRFFHQRGILLCDLIELCDGIMDFCNARFLFLRGNADFGNQICDVVGLTQRTGDQKGD